MEIQGSAALVTGGASGLGRATAARLVAAGAQVVILDRDGPGGGAAAEEIGATFAQVDVTNADEVQAAVEEAETWGPLRIAVNCAGVGWGARVVNRHGAPHDLDLFRRVVEINLVGTFNVLRLAAAAMARHEPNVEGERGVVVNTASIAAFEGQIGQVAYAASKAGVVGLTLSSARDLASRGVRVVTIAPGLFDTPLLGLVPEPTQQRLAQAIAFPPRVGHPQEFATMVVSVIDNPYLNGEVIRLDGGLRLTPQ